MLFYEGLHGAVVTETVNVAQHGDLLIGVVPVINLEWIQKLHRDKLERGHTQEAIVDTILRRMPDYLNYICPQFSQTHVNFQRVPTVDTSNPFIARDVPSPDESMLIIRFKKPRGIDFPYLLADIAAVLHVSSEHHYLPRQQDAHRDATHLHTYDLGADGPKKTRLISLLPSEHPLAFDLAPPLRLGADPGSC